jgi:hypothetical protein
MLLHDPPPATVNHVQPCFSAIYLGTDFNLGVLYPLSYPNSTCC